MGAPLFYAQQPSSSSASPACPINRFFRSFAAWHPFLQQSSSTFLPGIGNRVGNAMRSPDPHILTMIGLAVACACGTMSVKTANSVIAIFTRYPRHHRSICVTRRRRHRQIVRLSPPRKIRQVPTGQVQERQGSEGQGQSSRCSSQAEGIGNDNQR